VRFVPVKSAEQQSVLVLHRTRDPLIRQRTMLAQITLQDAHLGNGGSEVVLVGMVSFSCSTSPVTPGLSEPMHGLFRLRTAISLSFMWPCMAR